MARYVISLRRDRRDQAPAGWIDCLRDIAGLTVHETASPRMVVVEATEDAVTEARQRVGEFCHVELEVRHKLL